MAVVGGGEGVHRAGPRLVWTPLLSHLTSAQPERGVTKESFGLKQEKEAVKRAANIRSL